MKKTYLTCLSFTLLFAACQQQPTASTDSNAQNKAIARASIEAFNQHNWEKMTSYYADTALFLDPESGTDYIRKTHKEITADHQGLTKFSPDIKDSITTIVASGDKVVIEFLSSGTTAADNKPWKLPICTVLTIKDGKITKDATYYDLESQ